MNKQQLIEMLDVLIQREVALQLKAMKASILQELKGSTSPQKQLSELTKPNQTGIKKTRIIGDRDELDFKQPKVKSNIKYSKNPLLNELLSQTTQLNSDELTEGSQRSILDDLPAFKRNPLANVLNKDYSQWAANLSAQQQPRQQQVKQQPVYSQVQQQPNQNQVQERQSLRNSIISKMQFEPFDDGGIGEIDEDYMNY